MDFNPNHKIQALFTIVDYSTREKVEALFLKHKLPLNYVTHGHGAASQEIYDILGFGEPKKAILLSILSEFKANHMLQIMSAEINLNRPGTGIAFTIPINGCSNILTQLCSSLEINELLESEAVPMVQNETYDLILTIVNSGDFDRVMEVARASGANGGTLVHARGLTTEETSKFLGITIQPEKEIVMVLASHESKHKIMENITKEMGLSTSYKGICFSIPVSSTLGLGVHTI